MGVLKVQLPSPNLPQVPGGRLGAAGLGQGIGREPFKGSFTGDGDIGIDIDVDMDIHSDMAWLFL